MSEQLGRYILNNVYCEECVEAMRGLPDACIDLVVTSPPYDNLRNYTGYAFDFEAVATELYRVMKPTGVVVWVVGDKIIKGDKTLTSFKQALFFQSVGFKMHDVMIYRKKNTPFMRSNAYTNCYEFMFVLAKERVVTFNPLKTRSVRSGVEYLPSNKVWMGSTKKWRAS